MQVLFDDTLFVHYGFVFLSPTDEEDADLDESLRGQVNGLLGAGTGQALALITGTHTGDVPLRVEWYDAEPPIGDVWEDVVEASVDIASTDMRLAAFDDARVIQLPATGAHRVRLCAVGFEAARRDEDLDNGRVPDRYLLQLWAAPMAGDSIVRVSGPAAQYWHDEARKTTSMSTQQWNARLEAKNRPDAGGGTRWAPAVGRGLSEEQLLAGVPMSLRPELREPLARRACEAAGIDGVEPVRGALEALRRWRALPDTFADPDQVLAQLTVNRARPDEPAVPQSSAAGREALAVQALIAAGDPRTAMDLVPLLALAKAVTGMSGEDLIQAACGERGYG